VIDLLRAAALVAVAVAGAAVAATRDPVRQSIAVSFFGLLVALLFFLYQAPDVALSQIVVGAVALPLMILLTLAKVRRDAEERRAEHGGGGSR
jgi:energy-converting hydrogenase B subunit D